MRRRRHIPRTRELADDDYRRKHGLKLKLKFWSVAAGASFEQTRSSTQLRRTLLRVNDAGSFSPAESARWIDWICMDRNDRHLGGHRFHPPDFSLDP